MAESPLHRRMKTIVMRELYGEEYNLVEEPPAPPSGRVSWISYRPDILGYREGDHREEVVLVECETHPNMKRFIRKNSSSFRFQPFLFHEGTVRRILAVPKGRLGSVDLKLRSEWEVWILGSTAPVCKIGMLSIGPPTPVEGHVEEPGAERSKVSQDGSLGPV